MKGLLIDTSANPAILGLTEKDQITRIQFLEGAKNLTSSFFPALKEYCDIQDLNYIAVGVGPGSYMGIRTAAVIAKTLSFATKLPLIEFCSSLAFLPPSIEGSFAFIGDAKMGQFYVITGIAAAGQIKSLSSASLIDRMQLDSFLQNKDYVIGPEHLLPEPSLRWVAPFTFQQFIQGKTLHPDNLSLCYLR